MWRKDKLGPNVEIVRTNYYGFLLGVNKEVGRIFYGLLCVINFLPQNNQWREKKSWTRSFLNHNGEAQWKEVTSVAAKLCTKKMSFPKCQKSGRVGWSLHTKSCLAWRAEIISERAFLSQDHLVFSNPLIGHCTANQWKLCCC